MINMLTSCLAICADGDKKRKRKQIKKSVAEDVNRAKTFLKSTLNDGALTKIVRLDPLRNALSEEIGKLEEACTAGKLLLTEWKQGEAKFAAEQKLRFQRFDNIKEEIATLKSKEMAAEIARKKKWRQLRQKNFSTFKDSAKKNKSKIPNRKTFLSRVIKKETK